MGDTTTVSVELPAAVHEQFADAAAAAGTDDSTLLTDLIEDHVALRESIDRYADRETDSPVFHGDALEQLSAVGPPIAELIGFELTAVESGRSEFTFIAGPQHANPMGTLHGGVLCDVGDAAMGTAFASTLESGESFTTLELGITFLKPIWDAELTAVGEVVKRGQRTGLVECTITDASDALVAKLDSVCLILRGEDASGR